LINRESHFTLAKILGNKEAFSDMIKERSFMLEGVQAGWDSPLRLIIASVFRCSSEVLLSLCIRLEKPRMAFSCRRLFPPRL
jgi:hypothetical protein